MAGCPEPGVRNLTPCPRTGSTGHAIRIDRDFAGGFARFAAV